MFWLSPMMVWSMGPVLLPVIEPEKRTWLALQPLALVGLVEVLYENAGELLVLRPCTTWLL